MHVFLTYLVYNFQVLVCNISINYVCFQMILIEILLGGWLLSRIPLLVHWVCPYHWRLLCLVHKLYPGSIFWRGKFEVLKIWSCGKHIYGIFLTEGFDKNPFGGIPNNIWGVNLWIHTFVLLRLMLLWSEIYMSWWLEMDKNHRIPNFLINTIGKCSIYQLFLLHIMIIQYIMIMWWIFNII